MLLTCRSELNTQFLDIKAKYYQVKMGLKTLILSNQWTYWDSLLKIFKPSCDSLAIKSTVILLDEVLKFYCRQLKLFFMECRGTVQDGGVDGGKKEKRNIASSGGTEIVPTWELASPKSLSFGFFPHILRNSDWPLEYTSLYVPSSVHLLVIQWRDCTNKLCISCFYLSLIWEGKVH